MGIMSSAMSQSFLRGNENVLTFADHVHLITKIDRVIQNGETCINLNNCNITVLPKEFFTINRRMDVNLSHNQITDLSHDWTNLHITSLALQYNNLPVVPHVLTQCTFLEWLNLGHNPLNSISPKIGDITTLNTLWLNSTGIDELPKEIANLLALETFGARGNCIVSFPKDLCNLSQLSWLSLANNNIETLPNEFANLKGLMHLNMSHNRLKQVPVVLSELQDLEFCNLSNNKITIVCKEDLLKMLANVIRCLNLRGNKIININNDELKVFQFVVLDGCEWKHLGHPTSESEDSDGNSFDSSELYFESSEDEESDDQINNRFNHLLSKVAKYSNY